MDCEDICLKLINATWTGILKKKLRHDSQCNVVIAGNLLESLLAVEVTSHAQAPQASNLD